MNLLLVDDDRADAVLLQEALDESGRGVRLCWAASVAEGCRMLSRRDRDCDAPRFDLVLLDLNLPGERGLDLMAHLASTALSVPVIVLSSSGAPTDLADAFAAGVSGYLVKPADFDGYLALVRSLEARGPALIQPSAS